MWYIGQEIVCIKTHPLKIVKRGQIYIIKGLKKSDCSCNKIIIDVGFKAKFKSTYCLLCLQDSSHDSIYWLCETRFAPLEYNSDAIEELKNIAYSISV
jgi:hypothetical protein